MERKMLLHIIFTCNNICSLNFMSSQKLLLLDCYINKYTQCANGGFKNSDQLARWIEIINSREIIQRSNL